MIDEGTGEVIARILVGDQPHNVSIGTTRAFVPNSGDGTVTIIDLASYGFVASVPVGLAPHDVAVTPDGRLPFVTNSGSDSVTIIDVAEATAIGTIAVGRGPAHVTMDPSGGLVLT